MRNKKSKLMAFSLLALCFACLGFGVYALKNANMTVTGMVGFTAHDCLVKVVAEIEGDGVDANNVPNSHGEPSAKRDLIINKTENSNEMVVGGATEEDWNKEAEIAETIWFTDLTSTGEVSEIKLTFTVTNQSAYPIVASIANAEIEDVKVGVSDVAIIEKGATGVIYATFNLDLDANGEYPEVNGLPFEVKLDFEKAPAVQAPRNVVLNSETTILTFTEAEGATGYEVAYFDNGNMISSCEIAGSGVTLKNTPVDEGNYIVKIRAVQASEGKTIYSDYVQADKSLSVAACTHLAFELNSTNTEYVVSGIGDCMHDTIIVPSTYEGKPVVSIKKNAFRGINTFSKIVIPEGVHSVEETSFAYCKELASVYIPSTVTGFGSNAFMECPKLTSVNISDVDKWLEIYFVDARCNPLSNGANLYKNNELVTEVVIPDGSTSINGYIFYGCTSVKNISIPDSVQEIAANALSCCRALESIKVPEGVKIINTRTFYGCSSLTEVELPSTIYKIADEAFGACISLKNIDLPSDISLVGFRVFSGCTSLNNVVVPDNITNIDCMFEYCTSLTNITFPAKIQSINGTFAGCTSLETIQIPTTVTSMNQTFSGCTSLVEIEVPEGMKSLKSTFSGCTSLVNVKLPSTLTKLETISSSSSGVFADCDSLKHIDIPASVTEIGKYAFNSCDSLETVMIRGAKYITAYSFSSCRNLKWVVLPTTLMMIENGAFTSTNSSMKLLYSGSQSQFNSVTDYDYNKIVVSKITDGSLYYYSETSAGQCWHYVTDETTGEQVPQVW